MRALVIIQDADKHAGRVGAALSAMGVELDVQRAESATLGNHDGVLALPGVAHPDDATLAIDNSRAVIAQAYDSGLPVLGLCLGAQLLVQAAGGSAHRCSGYEIGFHDVDLTPAAAADPLLSGLPPRFSAFQYHYYCVELPRAGTLLATSPVAPQAFRLGASGWGVQFHPEADIDLIGEWTSAYALDVRKHGVDPQAVVDQARRQADFSQRLGEQVARCFGEAMAAARETAPN